MKRFLFLLLYTTFAFSCENNDYTTIPNLRVYFELNLSTKDFELQTDYAYKIFTDPRLESERGKMGFGGILVINGMSSLFAYDLACPVEANRAIRVAPDSDKSNITATCPKCGAIFLIATGTGAPQSGSKYGLRRYSVVGNGILYTVIN
jgi:nitrite reductase/ring-hydroxylating ferredoxin subunit